jgi:hypothetical protein
MLFTLLYCYKYLQQFCDHARQFTGCIKIGIPNSIANLVIPIGTTLHKNGSSMSSIIKIYVAFLIIGKDFLILPIYF